MRVYVSIASLFYNNNRNVVWKRNERKRQERERNDCSARRRRRERKRYDYKCS